MKRLILSILFFVSLAAHAQPRILFWATTPKYDADAIVFFNANTGLSTTQKDAVNKLVLDIKAVSGLWAKMKAIYPMVGGTAAAHKWNLKDPRDLDAAYRLTFSGGWTHSSTGADPNGSTGYAQTYLVPSTALSASNMGFGLYSRTNIDDGSCYDMGVTSTNNDFLAIRATLFYPNISDGSAFPSSIISDTRGYFSAQRTDGNQRGYINGSEVVNSAITSGLAGIEMYLGARNSGGTADGFSSKEIAFADISDGLTSGESASLYTAIQTFQTTLGRNI